MTQTGRFKAIWSRLDFKEANLLSAVLHSAAAIVALYAMMNSEWILINNPAVQNGSAVVESIRASQDFLHNAEACDAIGCHDFWESVRFGGYIDTEGKSHIAFHTPHKVLVDCITPSTANLFYVLIALCFVISSMASLCGTMSILPPPNGFLQWIRVNSILEMCIMTLTLCTCLIAIIAQAEVAGQRLDDDVTIGAGVFLVCFSGLLCFSAAMESLRQGAKKNKARRIDNQRILCARSLRSWRDAGRRPDDIRPIVDFERYLDECSTEMELANASLEPSPAV